jgi:zinc D-Ala-D-Ala dipeptidase
MKAPTIAIDRLAEDGAYRSLRGMAELQIDLRYAGPNNLLGRDLYGAHDCAWLHADAADALQRAARRLAREHPHLRLRVLDAARPQRVQELFWAHVEGTPMQAYFAPPERGSIHSFGMAVDVTLADLQGRELDMGTPFDDTTELSHPALEAQFLRSGALHAQQLAHRELLRGALLAEGWQGIPTEWWHFDYGDRSVVRATFRRIV